MPGEHFALCPSCGRRLTDATPIVASALADLDPNPLRQRVLDRHGDRVVGVRCQPCGCAVKSIDVRVTTQIVDVVTPPLRACDYNAVPHDPAAPGRAHAVDGVPCTYRYRLASGIEIEPTWPTP